MPVSKDFLPLIGSSGNQGSTYEIDQSIRFNDDDSPELTKTYSGAGSRTTQTFSVWFKLGKAQSSSGFPFFNGGTGTSDTTWSGISIYDHKIYLQGYSTNWKITTRLLRDPSAWYHLVYIWDTTNSTASERVRLYINGQRETDFSTDNNPGASASSGIGQAAKHSIGYQSRAVGYGYADAYFAEMHYLDGYAYGPEYFGEFESNGIWIPKEYTGSYGTNGFFIDGRDASDLGDDESGNGNDFTASGLAAHDQMIDTPLNNFCTMNSAAKHTDSGFTISNGNLDLTRTAANNKGVYATIGLTTGKWYWEVRTQHGTSYNIEHGVIGEDAGYILTGTDVSAGSRNSGYTIQMNTGDYYKYHGGSNSDTGVNAVSPSFQAFALDMDNNKIWFGYAADGDSSITWFESGDPAGGSNHIYALNDGSDTYYPCHNSSRGNGTQVARFNFGQDGSFAGEETATQTDSNGEGNFFFAPPSGFLAICTKNLSA